MGAAVPRSCPTTQNSSDSGWLAIPRACSFNYSLAQRGEGLLKPLSFPAPTEPTVSQKPRTTRRSQIPSVPGTPTQDSPAESEKAKEEALDGTLSAHSPRAHLTQHR